ncbi:hypothetical protein DF3PB_440017 [uncultured Defluviicoccus sp.]|uniref:Uncharacterized protein n=1 Tax=metagenome TaxID=256318 RepID=A0A380TG86_9ZZZZ|nr:hypothetical protein DF3PB_440017 [uncultured Defluviicoccus sp.]
MHRRKISHKRSPRCRPGSVVIHDLNIDCIAIAPNETDPPLIVDADAVLTCAVSSQALQTVTRRRPQVIEGAGVMELDELPLADRQDVLRHTLDEPSLPGSARGLIAERLDHGAF